MIRKKITIRCNNPAEGHSIFGTVLFINKVYIVKSRANTGIDRCSIRSYFLSPLPKFIRIPFFAVSEYIKIYLLIA
jgi:hypothetical protein